LKPTAVNVDTFRMNVTNCQIDLLARLMDVTNLRHEVIAQNVANVNTPGYRQQQVQFEEAFSRALGQSPELAAWRTEAKIVPGRGTTERADGNNVDIDVEMGQL